MKNLKIFYFLFVFFIFYFLFFYSPIKAVSPTPTPTKNPTLSVTVSPAASPSAQPTSTEDEKVKEIRDAIKEKVNEIKEKIEKRAYVGVISQITDSTISLDSPRGKRRVRITETMTIIGTSKKEIKAKDLSLDDKVIAMGTVGDNEILEAKRVIVIPKSKTAPAKRIVVFGSITAVDVKNSTLAVSPAKNMDQTVEFKIDQDTYLVSQVNPKTNLKIKDLKEGQKIILVHLETASSKTATVKSLFVLP